MLRLRALGGAALTRDDLPLLGAASQNRRMALLTVIACAGTQGVSRDTLLALLWPESSEDRARHALSQWLFLMRRDLGADGLINGSNTLSLNPEQITTDVADFDASIRVKDWSAAATLYQGPLLNGFLLSNAPEFERWLDGERDQRQRDVMRAVERLARDSESTDPSQAITWWQRLAVLDPHSGPTACNVIRLLAATGDTVAALAFARRHEDGLRNNLELSPSPDVTALVEKLRGEMRPRAIAVMSNSHVAEDSYLAFIRDRLAPRYIIDELTTRTSLTTNFSARRTVDLTSATLKVFVPELMARTDITRLLASLLFAATVQHRNIESPSEVAIVDGIVFSAVAGNPVPTLRDRLATEVQLPINSAIRIAADLAAALSCAHGQGLLHGNLTPRRITLHDDGARLTDVGVMPALSAAAVGMPHDSGVPSGTPSYMSPEQLLGEHVADAPSDVYGLGCVLYHMLTGQPPHAGSTARANITARLRAPAAPMRGGLRERPASLDALVSAMLERVPTIRPTAADVHRELSLMC